MALVELLILLTFSGYLIYKWATANYGVLQQRGLLHEKPWPLIGNLEPMMILGRSSFLRSVLDKYSQYKDCKVYGTYSMRDPVIVLRDAELIKKICIKDFDIFPNHQNNFKNVEDEIIAKSLFLLQDHRWKNMRTTLTPAFTGSKMRLMFELITQQCSSAVKSMEAQVGAATHPNEIEMEMYDFFTRFTNDTIASTAFGIKVDSFKDKNNEFFIIGSAVTKFSAWSLVKLITIGLLPKVSKLFRIKVMNEKSLGYFYRLVIDAMKYRQLHNVVRPDMIHLLMEAKQHHEATKTDETTELTDDDLLAQCLILFVAGFGTVSTCLSFTAHELLENPDVQQRLYEEIAEMEKELDGKPLNYDALLKMKYLDMVVSESLRKWPPSMVTDRVCSADYSLMDREGNLVVEMKKGDIVMIPIIGLHYDPDYFVNPEIFDPERFSDENKIRIAPTTYMPFGIGPRACIGNRLALMEAKALLYQLLLKFKIVAAKNTSKDLKGSINGFQMHPKDNFWMKFISREKTNLLI